MSKEKKFVCEKNEELELDITDLGSTGEGIGKIDGYTLFVKDALIGDKVRVKVIKTKKNYGYARLLEIIKPSEFRVEPECPVARQCGGCQLQHCSYEKQLSWKEEKVANCLRRIGGVPVYTEEEYKKIVAGKSDGSKSVENTLNGTPIIMEPILRMDRPVHYRNKAQFPVGYDKDGNLVAGFYAGRTHSIIPQTDCLIQHECNKQIVETVLEFMKKYKVTAYDEKKNKGIVRHILTRVGKTTGEVMVCLIINAKKLPYPEEFVEMIRNCGINLEIKSITVNINREKTNVILGEKIETLYGHSYIEDYIGDIKYRISPLSFYQVNPEQTKKLYQTALEFADIKESEVVWDLYCGIGTISLSSITLPASLQSIGKECFAGCSSLTGITLPQKLEFMGEGCFSHCISLTEVDIKECPLESLPPYTFDHCTKLLSIQAPNTITEIEEGAFYYCTSLTDCILPESVRTIGDYAFAGCSRIAGLSFLPEGTEKIGRWPFYGMKYLFSAKIPSTVKTIGDHAFDNCTRLNVMLSYPTEPPILGENVFRNVPQKDCRLGIPDESLSLYLNTPQWKEFDIRYLSEVDEQQIDDKALKAYFEQKILIVNSYEPMHRITLYTIDGRTIYQKQGKTTEAKIDTQSYSGEIFILSVQIESGKYYHLKLGRVN